MKVDYLDVDNKSTEEKVKLFPRAAEDLILGVQKDLLERRILIQHLHNLNIFVYICHIKEGFKVKRNS